MWSAKVIGEVVNLAKNVDNISRCHHCVNLKESTYYPNFVGSTAEYAVTSLSSHPKSAWCQGVLAARFVGNLAALEIDHNQVKYVLNFYAVGEGQPTCCFVRDGHCCIKHFSAW